MPTMEKMLRESAPKTEEEITYALHDLYEIRGELDEDQNRDVEESIRYLESLLNTEKPKKMEKIVTKDSLIRMIETADENKLQVIIGRALVGIFNRQTQDEQRINDTRVHNLMGFVPCDAHSGSITAKYFLKHRKLLDWQVERWIKPNNKGVPRIAKYWRQLNEIANEKRAS